jgi:hypothetical protein
MTGSLVLIALLTAPSVFLLLAAAAPLPVGPGCIAPNNSCDRANDRCTLGYSCATSGLCLADSPPQNFKGAYEECTNNNEPCASWLKCVAQDQWYSMCEPILECENPADGAVRTAPPAVMVPPFNTSSSASSSSDVGGAASTPAGGSEPDACCSDLLGLDPRSVCGTTCRNAVIAIRDEYCQTMWDGLCAMWAKAVPQCMCEGGANSERRLCTAEEEPRFTVKLPIMPRVDLSGTLSDIGEVGDASLYPIFSAEAKISTGIHWCDHDGNVLDEEGPTTTFYAYGMPPAPTESGVFYGVPGRTIVAQTGNPVHLQFHNHITSMRHILQPWIDTAPGLHVVEMEKCSAMNRKYPKKVEIHQNGQVDTNFNQLGRGGDCVPTSPHLHGGRTTDGFDGQCIFLFPPTFVIRYRLVFTQKLASSRLSGDRSDVPRAGPGLHLSEYSARGRTSLGSRPCAGHHKAQRSCRYCTKGISNKI